MLSASGGLFRCGIVAALLCGSAAAAGERRVLSGLGGPVDVVRDAHGIPHITADTWSDAARVLGYLHAVDRPQQMELLRRRASGTLAELAGPAALESDILMRRLGIRRGCEELWNSSDLPAAFREELLAYAAGVNARLAELAEGSSRDGGESPPLPAPWTPVDSLVFSKYMGWDQSGTDDDLWFGMLVEKLGPTAVESLWPLERPYEIPTVAVQTSRTAVRQARLAPRPGEAELYLRAQAGLAKAGWLGRGGSFGSNNWVVDGSRTASGKPIVANDPHLGFSLPSLWYAAHLAVAGKNLAGATFPGGPVVVLGYNDAIAWGVTNMQADAVDYFVESLDPQDPTRYRHRGGWKKLIRTTEQIAVRGRQPHELVIESTVHGPLVHRDERAVSLCWTGLGPTRDAVALWKVSRAENLAQFLAALDDLAVPALNMVYGDREGNIAIHPAGALPLRLSGSGRIPLDGASGDDDWRGWIPRHELPLAINPAERYLASANGRPHPLGYPYYLGWMWDPSYRTRRIHRLLSQAEGLTLDGMAKIQNDAFDEAAANFLPAVLAAIPAGDSATSREARQILAKWDFVAGLDTAAPAIWLRWFDRYRRAVWDDEWQARGIQQPGGSWGFTGDNRREPMLEVLEYITRADPDAIWFDDRATPQRESRDDMVARAWNEAIGSLVEQFGDDPAGWQWGQINRLHLRSLSGDPGLAREGGPVVGDAFTLNPGGEIGPVGGGASWRMLVDFGQAERGLGIYPGGQSEDPSSRHYDDLVPLWAKGQYVALSSPPESEAADPANQTRFVPAP